MQKAFNTGLGFGFFLAVTLSFLVVSLTGCSESQSSVEHDIRPDFQKGLAFGTTDVSNAISKAKSVENYLGITDYRNEVYYFPYTGDSFGKALSIFRQAREDLELLSFAGDSAKVETVLSDSRTAYATHAGYFVAFRKK